MIDRLVIKEDLINTLNVRNSSVDYWKLPIDDGYEHFNALLRLLADMRQSLPLFEKSQPLFANAEEKVTRYEAGQWVGYCLPHISIAKRASAVPSLYPVKDKELSEEATTIINNKSVKNKAPYRELGLIYTVILPVHSKLTDRQLRWFDLLQLVPTPLDSDTEVVHVFKNEYNLLRRLNVFTSAHPMKVLPFPISNKAPYLKKLQTNFEDEFLILPYFNIDESHAVSSAYINCLLSNGFLQKDMANANYQFLATSYADMIKRYERCFQLTAVTSSLMLARPEYLTAPETINPFDIAFFYDKHVDNSEYDKAENALPKSKQRNNILKKRLNKLLYGKNGIYKVYLPDSNRNSNGEHKGKSIIERFFIAGLHAGVLPKDTTHIQDMLSSLSTDTCDETNQLLAYNTKTNIAFFNTVNKDDRLLIFYLKLLLNRDLFENQNMLEDKLLNSTQPLSVIKQHSLGLN